MIKPIIGFLLVLVSVLPTVPRGIGVIEGCGLILFATVVLCTLSRIVYTGKSLLFNSNLLISVAVFYLVCLISIPQSLMNDVPWRDILRDVGPVSILLLSVAVADRFENLADIKFLVLAVIGSTLIIAAQIYFWVFEYIDLQNPFQSYWNIRTAIVANPRTMQSLSLGGLALIAAAIRFSQGFGRKIALGCLCGIIFVAILFTYTRSLIAPAFLIILIGAASATRGIWRRRTARTLGFVTLLVFALVVLLRISPLTLWLGFFSDRFMAVIGKGYPAIEKRKYEQITALREVSTAPLLGKGPGYKVRFHLPSYHMDRVKAYTHNLVTSILLHYGIIGGLAYTGIAFLLLKRLIGLLRCELVLVRYLSFSFILTFGGILIYSWFQVLYKQFSFNLLLSVMIGVTARLDYEVRGKSQIREK